MNEGGWGFGPQMLEALAARDVGGLPSGWGAWYSVSADTANADTKPEPETRPKMEQLEPAAPGWGATGATYTEPEPETRPEMEQLSPFATAGLSHFAFRLRNRWLIAFRISHFAFRSPFATTGLSHFAFRISRFAKPDISHFAFRETGHSTLRASDTTARDTL